MPKLRCPRCGTEMNRHAEKPEPSGADLLEEIHACPGCGNVESRRVPLAGSGEPSQDR